jgi:hypothetical protein
MSFVKSNPVRPTSAQLVADSDEDALSSSIESVTAPNNNNNNNLDVSLNSRNLLLEFDSGSESLQTKNPLAKFTNLLDIRQETESTSIPTPTPTPNHMTITDATILAIREATELNKNNNKRQRRITTNTALTIDSNGEDENGGNNNNNNNDDSIIQKQSIVGLHTAKELMSKVYDTYIELELPGNILYIYQIHPNREKKTGWCSFCRNSCACLWSMRRKTTTTTNKSSRFIQYDSRWASNEEFKRILITNRMLMDHFPNTVEDALSYFNTIDRIV